jgi:hypothetical protein
MPLFDAYLMVDWSASSKPKGGKDSIWWSLALRDGKHLTRGASENVRTRAEARRRLSTLLAELQRDGRRCLVGFDFPLAYPAGLAKALNCPQERWRGVWQEFSRRIVDADNNANNRFTVAGDLNRAISEATFPFWGHHHKHRWPNIARHKPVPGGHVLAERRLVEQRIRTTQPCWKIYGNGAVGSQALLGIPIVAALRDEFPESRAWPFETTPEPGKVPAIAFAEIYPSMFQKHGRAGAIKDKLQVEATVRGFASHDGDGTLQQRLEVPARLPSRERVQVMSEEGWILGVA